MSVKKHMNTTSEFDIYAKYYDADYAESKSDIPLILDVASTGKKCVLELACGTGRIVRPLCEHGYEVFGIDVSRSMIEIAEKQLALHKLKAQLTVADMLRPYEIPEVSLAILAANSFQLVTEEVDRVSLCENVYNVLEPGGKFYVDLMNPTEQRLSSYDGQLRLGRAFKTEENHDAMRFHVQKHDERSQLVYVTFLVDVTQPDGLLRRTVFSFTNRYLYFKELEILLTKTGFVIEEVFGDYDKTPFKEDSKRQIVVAEKPR